MQDGALISPASVSESSAEATPTIPPQPTRAVLCAAEQSTTYSYTSPSKCFLFQLLQCNQILCSSSDLKESCIKSAFKNGASFFFLQPKRHRWPVLQNRRNEMDVQGNFHGALLRTPYSLTLHSAHFQHANCEPELESGQNPPDTA